MMEKRMAAPRFASLLRIIPASGRALRLALAWLGEAIASTPPARAIAALFAPGKWRDHPPIALRAGAQAPHGMIPAVRPVALSSHGLPLSAGSRAGLEHLQRHVGLPPQE